MPPRQLVLIPPSKGTAPGGTGPPWSPGTMTDAALDEARREVLAVAGASGAVDPGAPTMPAIERYSGVLYRELDWASLPAAARRRGWSQVRIASGLWGLVAPADPIPADRVLMGERLLPFGRVSTWWRPHLAPVLAGLARGRIVWDLLPGEHSAACDWNGVTARLRVTVRFVDEHDRTVSHWNKLLKGALVRWLLTEVPDHPEELERFDHPAGYRYDPASSTVVGGRLASVVLRRA